MYNLRYIYVILLFTQCGSVSNDNIASGSAKNIEVKSLEHSSMDMKNLIFEWDLIPLETSEMSLIGKPFKIINVNDSYFIADLKTNSIFSFNENGDYNYKIDNKGKGPEEFISLSDFTIYGDSILLLDPMLDNLLIFETKSGKFNSNLKMPFKAMGLEVFNGNQLAFYRGLAPDDYLGNYEITISDLDLNVEDNIFPFKNPVSSIMVPKRVLQAVGSELHILPVYEQSIYAYTDGNLNMKYNLTFSENGIIQLDKSTILSNPKYTTSREWLMNPIDDFVYFLNYYENNSHIYFYYTINKTKYRTVFNKNTNTVYTFNSIENNFIGFDGEPIAAYGEYYLSYVLPDEIIKNKAEIISYLKSKPNNNLKKLKRIESLIDSDNGCLFLFKIK